MPLGKALSNSGNLASFFLFSHDWHFFKKQLASFIKVLFTYVDNYLLDELNMTQLDEAILIAANPFREYVIAPGRTTKVLGDVEFHREHLNRYGGVFWDIVPMGRRDLPWKHPEIHSGYFYICGLRKVKYWMEIEYIKRWKELSSDEIERYAPEPRRSYLQYYPECRIYYAILIREIRELKPERKLGDFALASGNKRVERVRNYVIVVDPGWR